MQEQQRGHPARAVSAPPAPGEQQFTTALVARSSCSALSALLPVLLFFLGIFVLLALLAFLALLAAQAELALAELLGFLLGLVNLFRVLLRVLFRFVLNLVELAHADLRRSVSTPSPRPVPALDVWDFGATPGLWPDTWRIDLSARLLLRR